MISLIIIIMELILCENIFAHSKDVEVSFIADFLYVEFDTIQVNAFLCWEKNDILLLTENLYGNNNKLQVQKTNVEALPYYEPDRALFLLDGNCNDSYNILHLANQSQLFKPPYKWLLLVENFEDFHNMYNLTTYEIFIDSYFYLGERVSDSDISLNEVYRYNKIDPLVHSLIANWTSDEGFINHTSPTILSDRRKDLMGTKIIASAVILDNDTMKHLWDYRNLHLDSITKLNIRLVSILVNYLNGTEGFEYYDSWGYKKPSETLYSGMIGAMQHGNAELGCTAMLVSKERLKVADFLSWTTPSAFEFVFLQPPLSYVSNLFTLPFSKTVWLSIIGLFLLSIILIYFITLWERKNIEDRKKEDDSFFEVVMLAVGAVCQQGTTYEPKSGTGKIITFLIFVALLFIYVSYSAYIVVLLQSPSDQIQHLDDLLHSKMEYGLMEAVYNHFYFEDATEPVRKAIYQQKILPKGDSIFMSLEEGVRRLRKGFFAFHAESPPIYTIISKTFLESEKCGIENMQFVEAFQFWLPVKKKSCYKEVFKVCLRKLHESGLQTRESNRLIHKKPTCQGSGNNFVSVGLIDAGPAFFLLLAGFGFSLFVFLLEYLVFVSSCHKVKKMIKKR